MTVKVQLKKGRKSVTAVGDTAAQARGRALAAWRKKYDAPAKGASFEALSDGSARPTPKASSPAGRGKAKPKAKKKPRTSNPAPAAANEERRRKAPEVARISNADRVAYNDRLVLGWSGKRPAEGHRLSGKGSLSAAQALAESDAIKGRDRTVLTVHSTFGGGRGKGAGGSADPARMAYGDRMVLAFDGRGKLVEWHCIAKGPRSLDEAVALAGSERIGGATRVVATVHSTYRS